MAILLSAGALESVIMVQLSISTALVLVIQCHVVAQACRSFQEVSNDYTRFSALNSSLPYLYLFMSTFANYNICILFW
jgi:hypothetical protein